MTMNQDSPIVAEVRRIRHEIAERCGNDIRKIIEYSKRSAQEFLSIETSLAGYVCPAIMTPKTFIENQTLEAEL